MQYGALMCEGRVLASRAYLATGLWERMRGLIGRPPLRQNRALLIERCGTVHTIGMRYALDLMFLDRAWRVLHVARNVPPGRLAIWGGWRACRTVEAASGALDLSGVSEGQVILWIPAPLSD